MRRRAQHARQPAPPALLLLLLRCTADAEPAPHTLAYHTLGTCTLTHTAQHTAQSPVQYSGKTTRQPEQATVTACPHNHWGRRVSLLLSTAGANTAAGSAPP